MKNLIILVAIFLVCKQTKCATQTIKIPQNVTKFDLANTSEFLNITMQCTGFITLEITSLENNLLKTINNSKRLENRCITNVALYDNNIEFIDKYTFKNFLSLKDLNLTKNCLKSFEIFGPQIEIIRLEENGISEISGESFQNLNNLKTIYLNFNKIQVVTSKVFRNLSQMNVLYLYKNIIETIDADSFSDMINLGTLGLNSNRLKRINNRTFRNLGKLTELMLYENEIEEIEFHSFADLKSLKMLHLYSNKIASLDKQMFTSLESLEELWLQKNELKSIEPVFNTLVNLVSICLDRNKIDAIDSKTFESHQNLNKVELFSNNLNNIDSLSFLKLGSFSYLNLSNNFLKKTFSLNSKYIVELNLNHNQLKDLRNNFTLSNLRALLVSENQIQKIYNYTFKNLKQLSELDLSRNICQEIE